MEYVTRLVLEICGTSETRVGPVDDQIVNLPERKPVTMRVARCLKVVGMDIPVEAMHNTFTRLGFEYTFDGEVFTVQAPSHRYDIEIEEDLIEEVARLYGYEKLPDRPPLARIAMKSPKEASRTGRALRREMAVLGYQELINFSFVPEAWEKDFAGNDAPIRLLNPIASQLSVMRTQLVGGLVDILKYNLNRKAERVRVFELGRVFFPDPAVLDGPWSVKGVRQPSHIAGLAYGTASDVQWGVEARRVDFYDVKGDVERLVAPLKARFVKEDLPPPFIRVAAPPSTSAKNASASSANFIRSSCTNTACPMRRSSSSLRSSRFSRSSCRCYAPREQVPADAPRRRRRGTCRL